MFSYNKDRDASGENVIKKNPDKSRDRMKNNCKSLTFVEEKNIKLKPDSGGKIVEFGRSEQPNQKV